jgi:minichromosome maintenance replisome factor
VTERQYHGMVRLAIARAKLCLRDKVTVEDANRAVQILKAMVEATGVKLPEDGDEGARPAATAEFSSFSNGTIATCHSSPTSQSQTAETLKEDIEEKFHIHLCKSALRAIRRDDNNPDQKSATLWEEVTNNLKGYFINLHTFQSEQFGTCTQTKVIQIYKTEFGAVESPNRSQARGLYFDLDKLEKFARLHGVTENDLKIVPANTDCSIDDGRLENIDTLTLSARIRKGDDDKIKDDDNNNNDTNNTIENVSKCHSVTQDNVNGEDDDVESGMLMPL